MKVVFDVTLMCITIAISLIVLHKLQGVREGTIAAAVCVGFITKLFSTYFETAERCGLQMLQEA